MKNKSITNLLRHYCNMHKDEIFDVHDVSIHFKNVPISSFRKYVSRLVEEGILLPISKGVYYIGSNATDYMISIAIKQYYLKLNLSRPAKETLLYALGIIDTEPEIKTYYINWGQGNKNILNYKLIETKNMTGPLFGNRVLLLDLIECEKIVPKENFMQYAKTLATMLNYYREAQNSVVSYIEHPRWVHVKLASLLDSMQISNTVMQDYVNNTKNKN